MAIRHDYPQHRMNIVMPSGGARSKSGPAKGYRGIRADKLCEEIKKQIGLDPVEVLARMGLKLLNDFNKDLNVREAVSFWNKMGDRVITPLTQEIEYSEVTEDPIERKQRIDNLLTRRELSKKSTPATTALPTDPVEQNSPKTGE